MRNVEHDRLSARQAQIAAMVVRGKSNREIAATLQLSPRTIETHIVTIFNRIGVRSRVELTAALLGREMSSTDGGAVPLPSLDAISKNTPRKLVSFISRQNEIAAIGALNEAQQLVSLVGTAGARKTSPSLEAAGARLARFDDGRWFMELALEFLRRARRLYEADVATEG